VRSEFRDVQRAKGGAGPDAADIAARQLKTIDSSLVRVDAKIESLRQRHDERRVFLAQHQTETEQLQALTRAEFQFQRCALVSRRSIRPHQREAHRRLLTQPFPPVIKRLLRQAALRTKDTYRLTAHRLLLNQIPPVLTSRDGSLRTVS